MDLAGRKSILVCFFAVAALIRLSGYVGAQAPVAPGPASQAPPAAQSVPAPTQVPAAPPEAAPSAQAPDWKTYSFPADGFSISFPAKPVLQKQSVPTDAGTFELRTYLTANPSAALYVGVCDYGEAANGSDPDRVLEGAKNGAVSNVNGHLIHSKKVVLGIYPGVAFEAEAQGSQFSGRIYLVGTILYQVFVTPAPGETYPETARFLDSFQLIPRSSS
jgi:hypothetical protein